MFPVGECHSPHGECGLKFDRLNRYSFAICHSPHGEGGLKLAAVIVMCAAIASLPAWGVWIEMWRNYYEEKNIRHSPHGECGLK